MKLAYPATCERRLLEYLWKTDGWKGAREILDAVTTEEYHPAYTTLHTTLRTMERKGWVRNHHGRWQVAVTRRDFAEALRSAILEVQDV